MCFSQSVPSGPEKRITLQRFLLFHMQFCHKGQAGFKKKLERKVKQDLEKCFIHEDFDWMLKQEQK